MAELALLPAKGKDRQEADQHDQDRKEDRPTNQAATAYDQFGRVAADPVVPELLMQFMCGVLDHNDGGVDENADTDRDPRQRHDVAGHAQVVHEQEADQHRQRQRHAHHERRAKVRQDQQDRNRRDDDLFPQRPCHGVNRRLDQPGAVVEGHDPHALGQAGLQLADLVLDPLGDREWVLAVAHQDHAADRLPTVLLQGAAPKLRSEVDAGNLLQVNGHTVAVGDDDVFEVVQPPQPTYSADQVLGIPAVEDLPAHALVAVGNGAVKRTERQVVRAELVRVHLHLVLTNETADTGDFRDARNAVELVADGPVLDRPQLIQALALAFHRVPEDLAEGRCVGRQVRGDSRGQGGGCNLQSLQHAGACEVEVRLLVEDDVDHREVELARRPYSLYPRKALQLDGQRVSDLVLDVLRAAAHPVGKDDHLVLRQVGNGVHRRMQHRVEAPDGNAKPDDDDHPPVADTELDNPGDHALYLVRCVRRLFHPRDSMATNDPAMAPVICLLPATGNRLPATAVVAFARCHIVTLSSSPPSASGSGGSRNPPGTPRQ